MLSDLVIRLSRITNTTQHNTKLGWDKHLLKCWLIKLKITAENGPAPTHTRTHISKVDNNKWGTDFGWASQVKRCSKLICLPQSHCTDMLCISYFHVSDFIWAVLQAYGSLKPLYIITQNNEDTLNLQFTHLYQKAVSRWCLIVAVHTRAKFEITAPYSPFPNKSTLPELI